MNTKTQIEIHGLSTDGISNCVAEGLSKVFSAYANDCPGEYIMGIGFIPKGEYITGVGFIPNSGCVYIALKNISIRCSILNRVVEYITLDFDGEEHFFDNYTEAQNFIKSKTKTT